jgi:Zn-dependent protease with chaperone function
MDAMRRFRGIALLGCAVLTLSITVGTAAAQTVVRPGFNIFSVDQDVEIGKQSALEAQKQIPMMNDAAVQRYVSALGAKLAANAPGPKFTYQFRVANLSDVNAFALPGGFVYVHRGLLEKVRSEGELAGVMSHEIAHVALRHPTNQASKAYLAQAGLGVLGGLFGAKTQSSTGQIIGAIGGFGLNTLFLKFSRSAESQADIVGSQIMAKSGYDPIEMAHFFSYLGQISGGDQGKVAAFLSDHPSSSDREARVRQEAALLGPVRPTAYVGNLRNVQTQLRRLPQAPSSAQLAQNPTTTAPADPNAAGLSIEQPSARYEVFQQAEGAFQIEQPSNWNAYVPSGGFGVTIVPNGGFVTTSRGQQKISYGVIVNHYVPFEGMVGANFTDPNGSLFGSTPLEESASDLVRHIQQANPYLTPVAGSEQRTTLSGQQSLSVQMTGRSPDTGVEERVSIVTRELPDGHVVYMLLIAPRKDYAALESTFSHMVRSLRVNDRAAHN